MREESDTCKRYKAGQAFGDSEANRLHLADVWNSYSLPMEFRFFRNAVAKLWTWDYDPFAFMSLDAWGAWFDNVPGPMSRSAWDEWGSTNLGDAWVGLTLSNYPFWNLRFRQQAFALLNPTEHIISMSVIDELEQRCAIKVALEVWTYGIFNELGIAYGKRENAPVDA